MLKITKALLPLLVVLMVLGLFGAWDRLIHGEKNLNLGSYLPWGLWVGSYIYLVGFSGGAFLVLFLHYALGIRSLRRASLYALPLALSTLGYGLMLVLADLGHMERFWKLYLQPNPTSILAWMVWVYTAYNLVLVAMLYALVGGKNRWLKPLSVVGFLLVITFGGGEGALLGVLGAKPYWNSGLLLIRFLFTAFLSGVALVAFTTVFFRHWPADNEHRDALGFLRYFLLTVLGIISLVEFAEFFVIHYAAVPAVLEARRLVIFGTYWWVFWFGQILLGLVVPAAILAPSWGTRPFLFGIATASIVIGNAASKQSVVLPILTAPDLHTLPKAFVQQRFSLVYYPSLTEWLFWLGVGAAAALVFLILIETLIYLQVRKEPAVIAAASGRSG
ncbi:MAG: polysulfide reductase NrfD [Deltaproteobacteria bacterium]|nr:polysulfide reductase NrfD [Deltaproteobacteria bacterium]